MLPPDLVAPLYKQEGSVCSGQWQLPQPHGLALSELEQGAPASGVLWAGARMLSWEGEAGGLDCGHAAVCSEWPAV